MRTRHQRTVRAFVLAVMVMVGTGITGASARAEEITVLAAGAVQKPVAELIAEFTKRRPEAKVTVAYDTVGALRDRVLGGESPDLVLLSEAGLKALKERGRLERGQMIPLGRTGVGLCAPLSAGAIDISTPEKLKAALLAAKSIAHADPARGATAGTHFRKVLSDLGILEQLGSRLTVVPFGGTIAGQVAKGEFALGVSQATEIVPNKDVQFLGTLPEPHALWTVYGLASVKGLRIPDSAAAELAVLIMGEEGHAAFAKAGFSP